MTSDNPETIGKTIALARAKFPDGRLVYGPVWAEALAADIDAAIAAKDAEIARLTAKATVMTKVAKAYEKLSMHYRTGTRPSEKLLKELEVARKAIELSDQEAGK